MEYNVIGKIFIKCPKSVKNKKALIIVGIISCLLALLLGIMIQNYYSISFVIPLIFLIRLNATIITKDRLKDVMITIKREENVAIIIMHNSFFINGTPYDLKYKYSNPDLVSVLNQQGKIALEGNYELYICDSQKESLYDTGFQMEIILDNAGIQAIMQVFNV